MQQALVFLLLFARPLKALSGLLSCLSPLPFFCVQRTPLLPGNWIKQCSQWDIAELIDSPIPLPHLCLSCAKVFIESWWCRPCMTLIHLNCPQRKKNLSHTCRVGRKQFMRNVRNQHFFFSIVQMLSYHFNVSCWGSDVCIFLFILLPRFKWTVVASWVSHMGASLTFQHSRQHLCLFRGQVVLVAQQNGIFLSKSNFVLQTFQTVLDNRMVQKRNNFKIFFRNP